MDVTEGAQDTLLAFGIMVEKLRTQAGFRRCGKMNERSLNPSSFSTVLGARLFAGHSDLATKLLPADHYLLAVVWM